MNIDVHQHFWKYDPVRDAWISDAMAVLKRDFLPDELDRECQVNGIDASVAVQADQSENETTGFWCALIFFEGLRSCGNLVLPTTS